MKKSFGSTEWQLSQHEEAPEPVWQAIQAYVAIKFWENNGQLSSRHRPAKWFFRKIP